MARPKKAIKRQKYVKVSYTIAEYKIIEKYASQYRLSRAEFVRNKSLNHRMKPVMTPEQVDQFRKLTGMHNNLNQLAKAANMGNLMRSQILKTIEGINKAIDELLK